MRNRERVSCTQRLSDIEDSGRTMPVVMGVRRPFKTTVRILHKIPVVTTPLLTAIGEISAVVLHTGRKSVIKKELIPEETHIGSHHNNEVKGT